jgi:hypothetical protein
MNILGQWDTLAIFADKAEWSKINLAGSVEQLILPDARATLCCDFSSEHNSG